MSVLSPLAKLLFVSVNGCQSPVRRPLVRFHGLHTVSPQRFNNSSAVMQYADKNAVGQLRA